jgi:hypothetical protein
VQVVLDHLAGPPRDRPPALRQPQGEGAGLRAASALLVVLAARHLRVGANGFGWLLAAIGAGALLGPFLSNRLTGGRYLDVRLLFVPYIIRGMGDMALGLVVGLPWALAILFVYGLNTATGMVASQSILQTVIPDRVRGRVFTLLDVTWAAVRRRYDAVRPALLAAN